ncbi:MAG: AMP-binding protein [Actinomycetota bacterium]|nr:AMP-binding protein [Actinomycetota bacterium]
MTTAPPPIAERRRVLEAGRTSWEPTTLGRFLATRAERYGDRPFVLADDRTLTYRDVDQWATELADGLAALGVRPGDRVGIIMANHPELVPLKFAVARAGAIAVPFNYLYKANELAWVLRQSTCSVLVTMCSFGDLDHLGMLDEIAPGWETAGGGTALPELRRVVQFPAGGPARAGVLTLDGLRELGRAEPGGADDSSRGPGDDSDIVYTSGTTGSPKGVVLTHDAPIRTAYASAHHRAFEDGRRMLFSLPCYHMFGYIEGLLAVMHVGGAVALRLTFDPADHLAAIERHRATDLLAVPTITVALLEHPDRFTRDLSSLFAILSAAAPAPPWVWERARDDLGLTEVSTGYGMTETSASMTFTLPDDPIERQTQTVGCPKFGGVAGVAEWGGRECLYRTADPVTGELLPEGEVGELVSRGPTQMSRYWDQPEETARTMRDGWLYSGDLGYVDDDGYLRLTGRRKELYKSGGELVMPKEIEELVGALPGVSQVYAIGLPDERWGEAGCLWIVPEPGAELDEGEILQVCRDNLAQFKVPKRVIFSTAAELPTTPTGKVQKFLLVGQALERVAAATG